MNSNRRITISNVNRTIRLPWESNRPIKSLEKLKFQNMFKRRGRRDAVEDEEEEEEEQNPKYLTPQFSSLSSREIKTLSFSLGSNSKVPSFNSRRIGFWFLFPFPKIEIQQISSEITLRKPRSVPPAKKTRDSQFFFRWVTPAEEVNSRQKMTVGLVSQRGIQQRNST